MTRTSNRSFAFVSSTFGATLVSIVAAWTVSSVILEPVASRDPNAIHLNSNPPASQHLYRISPIPAGADWTA
jgi:hypothetical protein